MMKRQDIVLIVCLCLMLATMVIGAAIGDGQLKMAWLPVVCAWGIYHFLSRTFKEGTPSFIMAGCGMSLMLGLLAYIAIAGMLTAEVKAGTALVETRSNEVVAVHSETGRCFVSPLSKTMTVRVGENSVYLPVVVPLENDKAVVVKFVSDWEILPDDVSDVALRSLSSPICPEKILEKAAIDTVRQLESRGATFDRSTVEQALQAKAMSDLASSRVKMKSLGVALVSVVSK